MLPVFGGTMSLKICVSVNSLRYPDHGGQMWVYLNWCLGLKELGCRVVWLEGVESEASQFLPEQVSDLQARLERYGLASNVAVCTNDGEPVPAEIAGKCFGIDAVLDADLLINLSYETPAWLVSRFRRSALIDIDPGLLQTWVSAGQMSLAPHTHYFTIGETVGQRDAKFPDLGLAWHYTPPPVCLEWWPIVRSAPSAPFTTISHWVSKDWLIDDNGGLYSNEKRTGFQPFLDLPQHTSQRLELALWLPREEDALERSMLEHRGWRVRDSISVSSTPWDYQHYIQSSLGEFSCVKPSCVRLQNAWISDRSLCYMGSGKPVVMQYTGPSRILPDAAGLFRFRDLPQAAGHLETVAADYDKQCRLARQLVEEFFESKKVLMNVLERAL
jgi:hypothetical protein